MGLDAFTTKLPVATFPSGGRSLGLLHTGSWRGFLVGGTPSEVSSFQGCLLPPLCFSALNILEAGGLQTTLLEKAGRKPCWFSLICLLLITPWGWPALICLMILHFSLLLLHSYQQERDGTWWTSNKFPMPDLRHCKYPALSSTSLNRRKKISREKSSVFGDML